MKGRFITPEEMLAIPAVEISDLSRIAPAPLVSVVVLTYNHEAYIAQNIESILAQQCDFPFELIIGEDHSPDQTLEICLGFQKKYPDVIRVVTWQENVGISANYLRVFGRARGKYLALLEGDDYWIDPGKLTKQVALMEQFPDTSLCGAKTRVVMEIPGREPIETLIGQDRSDIAYSFEDVLNNHLFHSSTFMFRKSHVLFTPHFHTLVYPDWYLQCLSALQGSVRCLSEVMSVWRHHQGGVCSASTLDLHFQRCEAVGEALLDIVGERQARLVQSTLDVIRCKRCHLLINEGKISEARRLAGRLLGRLAIDDFPRAVILLVHVSLPEAYAFLRRWGQTLGIRRYINRFSS
jgi:glycosyltransferase involved in cell wall biosynthesis